MTAPTVLVTGATGFIGGATVARLLLDRPDCRVLLLVRAESPAAAADRVARSLGRFAAADQLAPALGRCEIVCGDLTDQAVLADRRLDEATHVLHLASNTSFRSVRGVRHTNIYGALALAHRMRRAPWLERFLYVGTAYICGDAPPPVVHEDDYPRVDVRHLVEYTASKAECEMLLEVTAPELPLVVARPSVVMGHTERGCGPSASIFWFYRAVDRLRRINFPPDTRDDSVPVDYAADALLFLLFKPALGHRRYHISAGEASAVTWREIAAAFAECHGGRPEEPYRRSDFAEIAAERDRLRGLFGEGDEEHLLRVLEIYYRFCGLGLEWFDNRRLLAEGMPPAPRFTRYLHRCATLPPNRSVYEQMRDDE